MGIFDLFGDQKRTVKMSITIFSQFAEKPKPFSRLLQIVECGLVIPAANTIAECGFIIFSFQ